VSRKKSNQPPQEPDLEKIAALLTARIKATRFDADGLRIHSLPFHQGEWSFTDIPDHLAKDVAEWEYQRELERNYPTEGRLLPFLWSDFFPLSFSEIENLWGEKIRPETDHLPAFGVIDQDWFTAATSSTPQNLAFHQVRIDWSRGAEAIRADFEKWIKDESAKRTALRRRPSWKIHQDRLDQLAAWRAHRAGLSHVHFIEHQVRKPFSDASAFRTAWRKAEEILLKISKR
jgi:hypothetical protein